MSAYVVQDECINAIVTWVEGPLHEWEKRRIEESLEKQGTIGDSFSEKLGNAMFELNCNAIEQRYGDGQAKEFRPLDYEYKPNYLGSGYAVYDRFGEFLYQCSEGDVPESSDLFKTLTDIYNSMAHSFFRDLRDQKAERENEDRRELRQRIEQLEQLFARKRKV